MSSVAYIGFGSNLGDSPLLFRQAISAIEHLPGVSALRSSPLYRSAPLEVDDAQPDYLNAVFEAHVSQSAPQLLEQLLGIENRLGRVRTGQHHAARTIDLDLLLYDDMIYQGEDLVLPHPRMHQRAFVLVPLRDLAPALVIPGIGPLDNLLPSLTYQALQRLDKRQLMEA